MKHDSHFKSCYKTIFNDLGKVYNILLNKKANCKAIAYKLYLEKSIVIKNIFWVIGFWVCVCACVVSSIFPFFCNKHNEQGILCSQEKSFFNEWERKYERYMYNGILFGHKK